MFDHSIKKLSNGLRIITIPMPGVQSVTTLALVNTGSRYEKPKEEGIAHFFEHLVFKGTANYPDAKVLAAAIDAIGADFNAFTSKEYTGYYVKSAAKHVELALDVVSDMLLQPQLRQEDIDRERGVIVEEINMYHDNPMSFVGQLFDRMFFRGSGLSHDIIGSKKTVESLNRADFTSFLRHWYGLGNTVLVIAGNAETVQATATLELAQAKFAKEPDGVRPRDKVSIKRWVSSSNPISPHTLTVEERRTEQAHLVLGWPGIHRRDKDRYALTLLNVIMGGNMSSRLFTEVREKRGLCYYVRSDNDHYHDTGIFGASAGVDPGRIEEALKVIKAEFAALVGGEKPVTAAELAAAKEYIVGSMTLGFEDSRSVAQYFGLRQVLNDKIETPQEVLEKIRAVELEAVQKIARRLIKEREMRLAVIGPFSQEDQEKVFKKFVE